MLIGIDAHNLEGKRTGVGRYIFNLLKVWSTTDYRLPTTAKFILYFKDEIPADLPKSDLFKCQLLKVGSTAKFMHWNLPRAAKKDKVDILFCPGYIAPLFYSGKIALTLHDISYEVHPKQFNWNSWADKILLKWVSKKAAQKAKIIFTISEFTRREVIKYYGLAPEKIVVTPLAADFNLQYYSPDYDTDKISAVKKKFGIENKFIFFVGSIFSRRHLPEIMRAFVRVARERADYQFLLAGRDYTAAADGLVRQMNSKLGRKAFLRVDFLGDDELKLLYSACAFFIWLSDYEGFGLPVLEAMSCGAPVLTSDSSSLKEVAGEAALLIKDNSDIEEIYRAMKRLVGDENLRRELIRKGREQAAKFSWERCAQDTLNNLLSV